MTVKGAKEDNGRNTEMKHGTHILQLKENNKITLPQSAVKQEKGARSIDDDVRRVDNCVGSPRLRFMFLGFLLQRMCTATFVYIGQIEVLYAH